MLQREQDYCAIPPNKYYLEFAKSDLQALLIESGIKIEEELPVMFGAGRILKGVK